MAASAQLLLSALSKPAPEASSEPDPFAGVSGPDCGLCGLDGFGSGSATEAPLTSEPPLADNIPLTSEPPLAAERPLTSEPTAALSGAGTGCEPMEY
ncbi:MULTISPECIES: hypothetical protein [Streptomyces]|uniref:Secreted protein n=2 Tax=Streptomyces TaxID=1883 RepID=A0ABT9KNN1_9ACTN|nr:MULTISPECIES: hypothetical protein [Streptomyces]MBW8089435.1 hypothetical protein [Streptomyces hygroscopicus subsp. hygroscopicus]MCO8308138.1 hypothetical protein [Streptomyces sp. RKCA744]MDN3059259.1 hypothetical protein [Streptomyces sp. SRF1]MDP9610049.1 hypothetical protein [Streptomyces demainii]GHJ28291.1 hypothetical protein TPA0910_27240 [Streptomyces hygroscopicus]